MLRCQTDSGWFLIRHPDHARLAGQFAEAWGNSLFAQPEPRQDVLEGIRRHDDGWALRDSAPSITRAGKPSAFGVELVGKYTAFEEIDLPDYLAVRGRALEVVAVDNPYAALLISFHTCNLLTEHADRSTIEPAELPLLDTFLAGQRQRQLELRAAAAATGRFDDADIEMDRVLDNFRLLQGCDNLSLLSCVDFAGPATLLHAFSLNVGGKSTVAVHRTAPRTFQLTPWPFNASRLEFEIEGREVAGETFSSVADLRISYAAAVPTRLVVTLISPTTIP
jgi:hypothetical protein